jgi:hypothetical protein
MYVQFQVIESNGDIERVDYLLLENGYKDFLIEMTLERDDGHLFTTGTVYFPVDGRYPVQERDTAALEQYRKEVPGE